MKASASVSATASASAGSGSGFGFMATLAKARGKWGEAAIANWYLLGDCSN